MRLINDVICPRVVVLPFPPTPVLEFAGFPSGLLAVMRKQCGVASSTGFEVRLVPVHDHGQKNDLTMVCDHSHRYHKRLETPCRRADPICPHQSPDEGIVLPVLEVLVNGDLKTEGRKPNDKHGQGGDIRGRSIGARPPPAHEQHHFSKH